MDLIINNMQEGYQLILREVMRRGRTVAPRGQSTVEVPGVCITLTSPWDNRAVGVGRKFVNKLAYAEALQLAGGFSDVTRFVELVPQMKAFLDHDRLHGAYGPRIVHQMPTMIKRLESDSTTRQAVVTIWNPDLDLSQEGLHDYPCTIGFHFLIRDNRLEMHTFMRSNDVWLGTPYDIFQFTFLQLNLARILKVGVGHYVHHVSSLHLYDRDGDAAMAVVQHPLEARYSKTRPFSVSNYYQLIETCRSIWARNADTEVDSPEAIAYQALWT